MSIAASSQRDVTIIVGQTGSGKTTEAVKTLRSYSRVLVAEADFGEFPVKQFEDAESLLLHLESIRAFPTGGKPCHVPFAVGFSPLLAEHNWLFELSRELGNLALVLDEGDRFDLRGLESYDDIITRGRHYGVSLIVVGLHAFALPKDLRRQAQKIVAGLQTELSDCEALAEKCGPLAYELAPDPDTGKWRYPDFTHLIWTPRAGSILVDKNAKPLTKNRHSATLPTLPPGASATRLPGGKAETDAPGGLDTTDSQENSPCPAQSESSSDSP